MSYLIAADYKKQIQTDNLNQVIGSDTSVLSSAELAAQEEIGSYLIQKYDLSQEFTDTRAWSNSVAYKALDRVTDTDGTLYFGALPAPMFDYTTNYAVGNPVFWRNKVYTCLIATAVLSHNTQIQFSSMNEVPKGSVFPNDTYNGLRFWGAGVDYSITAGTVLTDAKWTKADNRSQQMVMVMVDVTLYHVHSRISPRNVPDIRVKRYDEAIEWLKAAGKGNITANLPLKQVHTGGRIAYGGNVRNINRYDPLTYKF